MDLVINKNKEKQNNSSPRARETRGKYKYIFDKVHNKSKLLTVYEYIIDVNYNIDKFMIDKCWHQMNDNEFSNELENYIYIDNKTLNWMGYNSEKERYNKKWFNKLLKNFEQGKDYKIYTNSTYEELYRVLEHPVQTQYKEPLVGRYSSQIKHTLVKPDTFRKAIMMLNTKNADKIRDYYLALEKLIKEYVKYQFAFREYEYEMSLKIKDDKIDELAKKLEIQFNSLMNVNKTALNKLEETHEKLDETHEKLDKTIEVAKYNKEKLDKTIEVAKYNKEKLDETHEKLDKTHEVIIRIAKERVVEKRIPDDKKTYLIIMKDLNDDEVPYYVIRTQKRNINNGIKQVEHKYPNANLEKLINIKHPNAVAFWEDIKQKYNCIEMIEGNWFQLTCYEHRFIKRVNRMNKFRLHGI